MDGNILNEARVESPSLFLWNYGHKAKADMVIREERDEDIEQITAIPNITAASGLKSPRTITIFQDLTRKETTS
jgi:hypothetical protein